MEPKPRSFLDEAANRFCVGSLGGSEWGNDKRLIKRATSVYTLNIILIDCQNAETTYPPKKYNKYADKKEALG
ncbi:hypothetical protein DL897_00285 [Thermoflavimicrobium daqui]|uniref:Uncharacterized protein n=1 Tax=Thermoflavimicrobium daqui TaxID=2137476 RepID=A0A364K8A2_9BACL|nr:hypothetical protein DL897_00285 [Thermoflavimicrobium daqui]